MLMIYKRTRKRHYYQEIKKKIQLEKYNFGIMKEWSPKEWDFFLNITTITIYVES